MEVVDGGSLITWKGRKLNATVSEKLILTTLVRSPGYVFRRFALAEAIGAEELKGPENLVTAFLCRLRSAFREIDPEFDHIETVWGEGVRWKTEEMEPI